METCMLKQHQATSRILSAYYTLHRRSFAALYKCWSCYSSEWGDVSMWGMLPTHRPVFPSTHRHRAVRRSLSLYDATVAATTELKQGPLPGLALVDPECVTVQPHQLRPWWRRLCLLLLAFFSCLGSMQVPWEAPTVATWEFQVWKNDKALRNTRQHIDWPWALCILPKGPWELVWCVEHTCFTSGLLHVLVSLPGGLISDISAWLVSTASLGSVLCMIAQAQSP